MEIVIFICMLVVPFISIGALVLALVNNKRIGKLKETIILFLSEKNAEKGSTAEQSAIDKIKIGML